MTAPFTRTLARHAAARYAAHDRFARHFASGKLGGDPVFMHLLREGLLPSHARVLDLGCGQGLLAAAIAAAHELHGRGAWPADWAEPPRHIEFHGVDLSARAIDRARTAGNGASFDCADLRHADLREADVVLLLDVLHYMARDAQEDLLRRVRSALAGGGMLLVRVADANGSLRFRITELTDRLITFARTRRFAPLHSRPVAEWIRLLQSLGFAVEARPMSDGTPFDNVLLMARYHRTEA